VTLLTFSQAGDNILRKIRSLPVKGRVRIAGRSSEPGTVGARCWGCPEAHPGGEGRSLEWKVYSGWV